MLKHEIQHNGQTATLLIPERLEEMTNEQFCEFGAWSASYLAEMGKESPSLSKVMQLQIKLFSLLAPQIDWETYPIFGEEIQNVVETIRLCIEQAHTTYIPKLPNGKAEFKLNGVAYYMQGISVDLQLGFRAPLTALELIEFQEIHDRYSQTIEQINKGENPNLLLENVEFTYNSMILAILYRRKNERLPLDETEREQWITQRSMLFKNAPATACLDAKHFFFVKRNAYAKKQAHSLALKALKVTGKKQHRQQLKKYKDKELQGIIS